MLRSTQIWCLGRVGLACLAAALAGSSASRVSASCGDYVTINGFAVDNHSGMRSRGASSAEEVPAAAFAGRFGDDWLAALREATVLDATGPDERRVPCNGPSCRRKTGGLPVPVAPVGSAGADRMWANVSAQDGSDRNLTFALPPAVIARLGEVFSAVPQPPPERLPAR